MNASRKFIKGIIVSLLLAFAFVITLPLLTTHAGKLAAPAAYAACEYDPNMEPMQAQAAYNACLAAEGNTGGSGTGSSTGDPKNFEGTLKAIQPPAETPQQVENLEKTLKDVAYWANWTHRLFAPLINYFSFKIGAFLSTDYLFEGPMGKMLHSIWVISRNLVNIAFVFLLLWLALKEIFFVNQESELSKTLVKFALLLVAVNFTWLGSKVVLDAANVVTYAVFAIPSGISDPPTELTASQCVVNADPAKPTTGSCFPTAIIAPADSAGSNPLFWEDKDGDDDNCAKVKKAYSGDDKSAYVTDSEGKDQINPNASESNKKLQKRTSICMENLNLINYDQNTAVIYLTYGMARIQNLVSTVAPGAGDQLAVSTFLSLVIQLAYTVSLLALFIALMIRMVILWLFVAFSPFIVLVIYFNENPMADQEFGGEFKFGLSEFLRWAFVPAKVGAVFAVSFIMISAGQAIEKINLTAFDKINTKTGFVFKIPQIETLFGGIGSLQQFIWLLMSLVILWVGAFSVMGSLPLMKRVTGKIDEYGRTLAEKVAALPYRAPILPWGKDAGGTSAREIFRGLDLRRKIDTYTGETVTADHISDFDKQVRKVSLKPLIDKIEAGTFGIGDANRLAQQTGFRDVRHMLEMDRNTFNAGIKSNSGYQEGYEGKIYDALTRVKDKAPSEQEKKRDAKIQADANAAAAAKNPPPASPPPTSPPAK